MEGVGGYFGNQLEVSIDCSQRQLNDLPVDWPSNITQSEDLKGTNFKFDTSVQIQTELA